MDAGKCLCCNSNDENCRFPIRCICSLISRSSSNLLACIMSTSDCIGPLMDNDCRLTCRLANEWRSSKDVVPVASRRSLEWPFLAPIWAISTTANTRSPKEMWKTAILSGTQERFWWKLLKCIIVQCMTCTVLQMSLVYYCVMARSYSYTVSDFFYCIAMCD